MFNILEPIYYMEYIILGSFRFIKYRPDYFYESHSDQMSQANFRNNENDSALLSLLLDITTRQQFERHIGRKNDLPNNDITLNPLFKKQQKYYP